MEYKYLYHDKADEYMPRYDAMKEKSEELSDLSLEKDIWEHQLLDELKLVEKDPDRNYGIVFRGIRLVLFSIQKRNYLYKSSDNLALLDYFESVCYAYRALSYMGDKSFERSTSEEYREMVDKVNEYYSLNIPKLWKFFAWLLSFIAFWAVLFRLIATGALAGIAASTKMETVTMAVFSIGIILLGIKIWLDTDKIWAAIAVPLVGGALVLVICTNISKWVITHLPGMAQALKDANEYFFTVIFLLFMIHLLVTIFEVSTNAPAFTKKHKMSELASDLIIPADDEDLKDEAFFFGLMVDVVDFCENRLKAESDNYLRIGKSKEEADKILSKVRSHFAMLLNSYNQAVEIAQQSW